MAKDPRHHYGSEKCVGDWVFNCRFCEEVYFCANIRFSSQCILTAAEIDGHPLLNMGRSMQVFGQPVSHVRYAACLDAIGKIFFRSPPFTFDGNSGVLVPDLSDRVTRELRSFKEYRQDQFEEIFRPRKVGGQTPLSRIALLRDLE